MNTTAMITGYRCKAGKCERKNACMVLEGENMRRCPFLTVTISISRTEQCVDVVPCSHEWLRRGEKMPDNPNGPRYAGFLKCVKCGETRMDYMHGVSGAVQFDFAKPILTEKEGR